MRYAVISDIHSNLEALTAFFEKIDTLDVEKTVCLGDIVGYNTNPNECIELLKKRGVLAILGNHDTRAIGLEEPTDFNFQAALAVYWTREVLTEESREYLNGLPRTLIVDKRFLAIHGWVNDTDRYILGARDAGANFELMKEQKTSCCFFGHTHVPVTFVDRTDAIDIKVSETITLEKGFNYLINPGSIGQPRDRDPRASFLIYDSKKSEVAYHRFEYDIQSTADKIIAAGLPERLAARLKLGW